MGLRVFYSIDHDSHFPVGAASIVVAVDTIAALAALDEKLTAQGLKPFREQKYTLIELKTDKPCATILVNGDY